MQVKRTRSGRCLRTAVDGQLSLDPGWRLIVVEPVLERAESGWGGGERERDALLKKIATNAPEMATIATATKKQTKLGPALAHPDFSTAAEPA